MKKILLILVLLSSTLVPYAQKTCEQREDKLLSIMETFSAGFLYNTYGVIGSITDGFVNKGYSAETTTSLLQSQILLADNIIKVIDGLLIENHLKDKKHQDYCESLKNIMEGLKLQSNLVIGYTKKRSSSNLDALETQRKNNWSAISKLMGIEE